MSTQQQLKELMEFHKYKMEELSRVVQECPWENEEYYAAWCAQSYNFVCHATRILAACAARLGMEDNELHLRFLDHCQEEKNHEKLYEQDLEFLRRKPEEYYAAFEKYSNATIVNFSYGASDAGKAEVVTNNELEPRQGNIAEDVNVLEIVQETASEFAVKKMETSYF
jgi:hypothetical protein